MKQIRPLRGHIYRAIFSGFALFFAYFLIWSDIGLARQYSLQNQIAARKREFSALKRDVEGIEREISTWEQQSFQLEKMAREELGMGFPGEKVVFYYSI